ncbi:MAG: hypothetical protein Q7S23_05840 [bacterium]|nr:hypothetical protein [bacterium]
MSDMPIHALHERRIFRRAMLFVPRFVGLYGNMVAKKIFMTVSISQNRALNGKIPAFADVHPIWPRIANKVRTFWKENREFSFCFLPHRQWRQQLL